MIESDGNLRLLGISRLSQYLTNLHFDKDEANLWKRIWKLNITPKVNMFCWKVVNNALALGKNMSKYVKDTEPYCMMCDNHNVKDGLNLFVNCSFSRKVWKAFNLNNIHLNSGNTNILQWFKTWMNVKSLNENHNLISFILWSIWKYRNSVHFDNVVPDVQKLIDNIRASHLKLSLDRDSKDGHVSTNAKKSHYNGHNSDSDNYDWFIHFDASFIEADYTMGYAISILDKTWTRKHCRAGCSWASIPLEAEAKAGIEAIRWMEELKLQNCCIISDCQILMKILKGEADPENQP
ncbi:uncharacterized protein LOC113315640 [Papaver somniferum]|uniref:uncharacterized protein LOC113315640 n=1 Tax=Papaver somniferum TaxID=3469 RepID=UPI000E6F59F7|nr:uncharacterized protein LOC113315640 [Papaver somniferum]